jgi:hypothetical protein
VKIIKIVGVTIVLLIGAIAIRVIPISGIALDLEEVAQGQCEIIPSAPGAEDITIDKEANLAFVASDDRRAYLLNGQNSAINGALWTLDLNKPDTQLKEIEIDVDFPFHPHGISLFKTPAGEKLLYVINHISTTEHEVDVFLWLGENKAGLIQRIRFPELISPNDLHVVGRHQFYVTNDHGSPRHTIGEKLEDFLVLPLANVLFYDQGEVTIAVDSLYYANGVITSNDQSRLFVAESSGRQISAFSRSSEAEPWHLDRVYPLETMPDNLEQDEQGRLLTGGHPKAFDFMAHSFNGDYLSPSEVVRVDVNASELTVDRLYLNLGDELSGSSVAASHKGELLIGSVFEERLLRCKFIEP